MANRRRLSLTLDSRLYEKLATEAAKKKLSLPETARRLLTEYFRQQEENQEVEARYEAIIEQVDKELDAAFQEFWKEWGERKKRDG